MARRSQHPYPHLLLLHHGLGRPRRPARTEKTSHLLQALRPRLGITILCGVGFMVVKFVEYKAKFEEELLPGQPLQPPRDAPLRSKGKGRRQSPKPPPAETHRHRRRRPLPSTSAPATAPRHRTAAKAYRSNNPPFPAPPAVPPASTPTGPAKKTPASPTPKSPSPAHPWMNPTTSRASSPSTSS